MMTGFTVFLTHGGCLYLRQPFMLALVAWPFGWFTPVQASGGGATYLMSSADSLSPLVGASANISGILGAYWVGCRQHSVALLGLDKPVHGGVFTALFIGVQIMPALLYTDHHVGIAFLCHVVGWMAGVLVALGTVVSNKILK